MRWSVSAPTKKQREMIELAVRDAALATGVAWSTGKRGSGRVECDMSHFDAEDIGKDMVGFCEDQRLIGLVTRLHGRQLYQVALHELGHALGIDHVHQPRHIMEPRGLARAGEVSWRDRQRWTRQLARAYRKLPHDRRAAKSVRAGIDFFKIGSPAALEEVRPTTRRPRKKSPARKA